MIRAEPAALLAAVKEPQTDDVWRKTSRSWWMEGCGEARFLRDISPPSPLMLKTSGLIIYIAHCQCRHFFSFRTENSLQQSSPWEFALRRQPAYEMRCAGARYRIPSSTLKHLLATLRMEYLQRRTMAFPFPTYARLQMTNICSRFLPAAQQKTHTNTNTHSDSWAASMANYLLMSANTEIKNVDLLPQNQGFIILTPTR